MTPYAPPTRITSDDHLNPTRQRSAMQADLANRFLRWKLRGGLDGPDSAPLTRHVSLRDYARVLPTGLRKVLHQIPRLPVSREVPQARARQDLPPDGGFPPRSRHRWLDDRGDRRRGR